MRVYKIRNTATGLFSSGGGRPRWVKSGKIWHKPGHVRMHMRRHEYDISTVEIVEFECIEIGVQHNGG